MPPHGEEEGKGSSGSVNVHQFNCYSHQSISLACIGADGPPRTPPPRKGDPLEDLDTVICHFEEGGEQQRDGVSWGGSSWGGGIGTGQDYVNYGKNSAAEERGR